MNDANKIFESMSTMLVVNMLNNLNSMGLDEHELVPWNKIPIDSRFHSSRKLVVGFFNVLVIKQFEGLALTDVFHTSNCNMFFCNCKLISSNKICGKVERYILSKVLYGDSLDIKSLHKEYKHRYMMFKSTDATTMFCDLLNGDVYDGITFLISNAENVRKEIEKLKEVEEYQHLIDGVTEILKKEITLAKVLTPYYYSMVHIRYDAQLYEVFDEIVEHHLNTLNVNTDSSNLLKLKCVDLHKFDDKFKKHYLFELNRLLDTINFELFGYDGRTFQKNAWYENTIGDKILFTRDDLITIKKIVGIIPIVIERDASVSQEDDVAQYIHRYMDNEIYYHKNNWYYKTKDHDRVKNRIIKSQYYFYGSSYKHNQYALNYFKYISKSETKGNLDSELVFKLIKSLIYLEYLNPAPNDKYESKSNKDTLRRIDELIALTGYRYRRKDNKRVPFGIPVKTLEEFSWLFQDYCMHREGTKRTTTKLPPSEMVELDKKVFAIVILFQSKDYRTFVDLM